MEKIVLNLSTSQQRPGSGLAERQRHTSLITNGTPALISELLPPSCVSVLLTVSVSQLVSLFLSHIWDIPKCLGSYNRTASHPRSQPPKSSGGLCSRASPLPRSGSLPCPKHSKKGTLLGDTSPRGWLPSYSSRPTHAGGPLLGLDSNKTKRQLTCQPPCLAGEPSQPDSPWHPFPPLLTFSWTPLPGPLRCTVYF